MTALYCFIDQRIASLLYSHYSKDLSLYKCCLAKFGCTTIIVILQILFDRRCLLRKQPLERRSPNDIHDIELSYPRPDVSQSSITTTQPLQHSSSINNQTPSFNLRSNTKSTPNHRVTFDTSQRGRLNFDAIETENETQIWYYQFNSHVKSFRAKFLTIASQWQFVRKELSSSLLNFLCNF